MIIYLIRHGATEWNRLKLLQGQTDIPLNEDGIASAIECGKELENIAFTKIYVSPLQRAYKTAELIRGDRDIPLIVDERIKEIAFGDIEGVDVNQVTDPTLKDNYQKFFYDPVNYQPIAGGETLQSLVDRADDFMEDIASKEADDSTVLVVAHGAVIKALQMHALGRELPAIWQGGVPGNCAACIMEYKDGQYTLLSQGESTKY